MLDMLALCVMNRGFAILHKSLSFFAGACFAGIGYLSLSNQLVFRNNYIHNQLLASVKNREYVENMQDLPTSKDYLEITTTAICTYWNRSILYLHRVLSSKLHYGKPFDEKVDDFVQKQKHQHETESSEKTVSEEVKPDGKEE